MKISLVLLIICIIWSFLAPSCMQFRISDSKAKANFANEGVPLLISDIRVNGHNIHYVATGADSLPTLFFIHGSPGAWNAFEQYLRDPRLLAKYRMISIDRPGFGYSEFGHAMHLEDQVKSFLPLLANLQNGKPFHLIGHSLGGPIVVMLAARAPGLIKSIMIMAGSVDPAEEQSEVWRGVLDKTPLYFMVPGAFKPSNRELAYFKKDVHLLPPEFAKVTCKVYLVHGDKDDFVPPGNVEYAKKQLVNASAVQVLMFPGANHFIPWTRYDQIRDLLLTMD